MYSQGLYQFALTVHVIILHQPQTKEIYRAMDKRINSQKLFQSHLGYRSVAMTNYHMIIHLELSCENILFETGGYD